MGIYRPLPTRPHARATVDSQDLKWFLGALCVLAPVTFAAVAWPELSAPILGALFVGLVIFAVALKRPKVVLTLILTGAVLASGGVGVRFLGGSIGAGYTAVRLLVAGLAVTITICCLTRVVPLLAREVWLLLLLTLGLLSLTWSESLKDSGMLLAGMTSAVLIGSILAAFYDRAQAAKLILYSLSIASALSLALVVLVPTVGTVTTPRPGGLVEQMPVGVFTWNSELGFASGVAAVLAFAFWLVEKRARFFWLAALMLTSTVMSDSATAILSALAGFMVVLWFRFRAMRVLISLVGFVALVLWAYGEIANIWGSLLGMLGRTSDLTGRSVIWPLVMGLAKEHPELGYGIGAGPDLSPYLGFSAHAHNGYLQLLLELGYVGVALFAGSLIFLAVRIIRTRDAVLGGVLAVFLVVNIANNFLVSPHLAVILYAWCAVTAAKPTKEKRPASEAPKGELHRGPLQTTTPN